MKFTKTETVTEKEEMVKCDNCGKVHSAGGCYGHYEIRECKTCGKDVCTKCRHEITVERELGDGPDWVVPLCLDCYINHGVAVRDYVESRDDLREKFEKDMDKIDFDFKAWCEKCRTNP